jgi:hypothetical protein
MVNGRRRVFPKFRHTLLVLCSRLAAGDYIVDQPRRKASLASIISPRRIISRAFFSPNDAQNESRIAATAEYSQLDLRLAKPAFAGDNDIATGNQFASAASAGPSTTQRRFGNLRPANEKCCEGIEHLEDCVRKMLLDGDPALNALVPAAASKTMATTSRCAHRHASLTSRIIGDVEDVQWRAAQK